MSASLPTIVLTFLVIPRVGLFDDKTQSLNRRLATSGLAWRKNSPEATCLDVGTLVEENIKFQAKAILTEFVAIKQTGIECGIAPLIKVDCFFPTQN